MADRIKDAVVPSYGRASQARGSGFAIQPTVSKAHYEAREALLVIELTNGVTVKLPPGLLQGSKDASAAQLARVDVNAVGTLLHWDALESDLGLAELAAGIFGAKTWMSALARFAGSQTSARKAASSRENGRRGGRPRLHKGCSVR